MPEPRVWCAKSIRCRVIRPTLSRSVAEKAHADLLVVGNQGMQGAKRFMLGSVPNKLSHHAPCSILIVDTTH